MNEETIKDSAPLQERLQSLTELKWQGKGILSPSFEKRCIALLLMKCVQDEDFEQELEEIANLDFIQALEILRAVPQNVPAVRYDEAALPT